MKQFFITFFANLAAILFVLAGPVLLFLILLIASISAAHYPQRSMTIERGSVLTFDMSLNVVDSPEHAQPTSLVGALTSSDSESNVTLRSLTLALKKAAIDERIKALFITGLAGAERLRLGLCGTARTAAGDR